MSKIRKTGRPGAGHNNMKKYKGIFITFEGFEGSGKSTQAKLFCRYLQRKRKKFLYIREPGTTNISEEIRKILLNVKNKEMSHIAEALLYMAARAQLVEEIIEPALKKGKIIICDRFLDSTLAYQGYGCGIDIEFIKNVGRMATKNIKPDLTLLFNITVEKGLSRRGKIKDRIERRSLLYHNRVRDGYLKIARQEPQRIKIINADDDKMNIQHAVRNIVNQFLAI